MMREIGIHKKKVNFQRPLNGNNFINILMIPDNCVKESLEIIKQAMPWSIFAVGDYVDEILFYNDQYEIPGIHKLLRRFIDDGTMNKLLEMGCEIENCYLDEIICSNISIIECQIIYS